MTIKAASLSALAVAAWIMGHATAHAYTVFVTNEKDNTLSVIDSTKLEVVKTIKIGQRPRGVILTVDHKWLLVCASDDNTIQVFDPKTLEFVKNLPSGPDPELFVLHPNGNPLYVANEDDNLVTVVDIEKGTIVTEITVGVEPEGLGISPDGKILVNTSETTNMAHFIDTTTNQTIDNVLVDARPRVAIFSADGAQLWVSSEIGGTVSVIDPKVRKIIGKISFEIPGVSADAIQPVGVRISKDNKNTATLKVEKYLLVGQRVWNLGFTPDEKLLFTTNGSSNDVSVIDVEKQRVIKSIKVGRYPWGVVVAPF
jgi:PQQ-dependent catabolism-associated beta-propeller protein